MGAALAATRRSPAAGFDPGRNREQARSHGLLHSAVRRTSAGGSDRCRRGLYPAPRTARRRCRGRKTPPTEPLLRRRCGWPPVGAALAATRRSLAAGFDPSRNHEQARSHGLRSAPERGNLAGSSRRCRRHLKPAPRTARRRCRGRKTPPTEPRLRRRCGWPPVGDSMFRRKRFRVVSGHSRPRSSSERRQRERVFLPAQPAPGCG